MGYQYLGISLVGGLGLDVLGGLIDRGFAKIKFVLFLHLFVICLVMNIVSLIFYFLNGLVDRRGIDGKVNNILFLTYKYDKNDISKKFWMVSLP